MADEILSDHCFLKVPIEDNKSLHEFAFMTREGLLFSVIYVRISDQNSFGQEQSRQGM